MSSFFLREKNLQDMSSSELAIAQQEALLEAKRIVEEEARSLGCDPVALVSV